MTSQSDKNKLKKMFFEMWFIAFIIQLFMGSYAIYNMAAEYPDMGFIEYTAILGIGAAVIGAILTLVVLVILFIAFSIVYFLTEWKAN